MIAQILISVPHWNERRTQGSLSAFRHDDFLSLHKVGSNPTHYRELESPRTCTRLLVSLLRSHAIGDRSKGLFAVPLRRPINNVRAEPDPDQTVAQLFTLNASYRPRVHSIAKRNN